MKAHLDLRRVLGSVLFLTSLAMCVPVLGEDQAAADLAAKVDGLFEKVNRRDVAGCSVGVVHHGKLVYSKGFGSANLEYQVPNTPQTVFETASFSKTFTSLCLAFLMDEGKVSPDDDLRKFVPEMHAFDPPVRVRDLVRCRSGLWDQVSV